MKAILFISIILPLRAIAVPSAGDLPQMPVTVKKEYRCEVQHQLWPTVIHPETKKNFRMVDTSFVEFEKPVKLNGVSIYGVGIEEIDLVTPRFVIFKKEETGSGTKFTFGIISVNDGKLTPVTNIPESIKNFKGKQRIGFFTVNKGNPKQSVFLRAPLQTDLDQDYLRPLQASCLVKEKIQEVNLFQNDLGNLSRPW